ncbi:MAG TPA: DUF1428 domain-containing protein [Opitutaceae bacterium]|jgi:uncharacterized protein YbaA (DUF1428 family)|nr:DUF1428 domain-containing protein [Opitutaceae bacterium]HRJ48095.1 DUF1428 domain-containing protein [Opitutaceae bacterium]
MPKSKATYADGFVIPVPVKKLAVYRRVAAKAGRIWREYGALDYKECVGDDLQNAFGVPFKKLAGAKAGETVVFSWITYRSRAHRDRVNAKIMQDPRILAMCGPKHAPFDPQRMAYGGFRIFVSC